MRAVSRELQKHFTGPDLAELRDLFGPPPVLSTENAKAYDEILARLMQCLDPRDFMERLLIKQLVDCTWEMMRYTRHKTMSIERKFRQRLELQSKAAKASGQNREARLADSGRANALGSVCELEKIADGAVRDAGETLTHLPHELDQVGALEASIGYHGQLDHLLNAAVARRNDVLEQVERYKHGSGKRLRKTSNAIIEAEFSDSQPAPQRVEAQFAPSIEQTQ
jgi:hypothetical protein